VPTTESSGRVPGNPGIEGDSAGKSYRKGPGERTEALVEEDVGIVTEALIALVTGAVTGVLGLLSGYVFGVLRTLNERRNERRDVALAEIFKEMDLFHRYLGSWADDPTPGPNEPSAASKASGIPARKHVSDQYNKFVLAFHGNAIWLGKDTYELIQEFSAEGMGLLNGLSSTMAGSTHLPDGTRPKARWKD
jgi:hypothetical protein